VIAAPPALVAPAPDEVSFGRIAGIAPRGAHELRVRVGRRLVAERRIRGRSFDFFVSLPRGEHTVRVQAGRRTFVVPRVVGLPLAARPREPFGHLDARLQASVVPLASGFHGTSEIGRASCRERV